MMKRNLAVAAFLLFTMPTYAQQELGLHFMNRIWQASQTNPALIPEQQSFLVGIGSVAYQLFQPDIRYGRYIVRNPDGSRYLDIDNILAEVPDRSRLEGGFYIETLRLGIQKKQWQFGFHHAVVNRSSFEYPKDMLGLLWKGNAPYIGDTLSLGPDLNITQYNEIGLQAAYSSSRLKIGAGIKILSGIFQVTTLNNLFTLHTDQDIYQLDVNTNYSVQTSGLIDYTGFSDTSFIPSFETDTRFRFTENTGIAFDFGLNYNLTEKFSISASIVGLGSSITWKKGAKEYNSKGHYNYEGEDVLLLLESNTISIDSKLDTIREIFDFKEKNISYTSKLPVNSYISALYRINDRWQTGALVFIDTYGGITKTAYAVNGQYQPTRWLSVGTTWSYKYQSFDHLGINFVLKLGPVQMYGVTDNVLTALSPGKSQATSGRIGLNLLFSTRAD